MNIFRSADEVAEFLLRQERAAIERECEELADAVALWVMDRWILDTRRDSGKTKENDL